MLQAIYHGAALAVMVNGYILLQQTTAGQWISDLKGGHMPFLTIQGYVLFFSSLHGMVEDYRFDRLAVSCITCAFAFLADIAPSVKCTFDIALCSL